MNDLRFVIFLVFAAIALINHFRRNVPSQHDGQRVADDPPDRPKKVQSDIEAFLSEVGAATDKKRRSEQSPEPSRQQRSKKNRRRTQQIRRRTSPQREHSRQPSTEVTPVNTRSLGSGISEHVDTYISQHVAEHVESHTDDFVEVDIVDSVESHLGDRPAELSELTRTEAPQPAIADEFRSLLRSRSGVRQAILINEVLKKPRGLER
ncbi:MAG: hypothetical protein MK110_10790 [Fuerstiella sp.]|nr:hypothetical protein [Fuerstiella sp.]